MAHAEADVRRAAGAGRPSGRFWLYAPYGALLLLAVAWSAGWLAVRNRAETELDRWLSREASFGRPWTCADRRVGGYPFRVTLDCASLSLDRGDLRLSFGRARALVQVYQPRHLIAEAEGPLRFADGRIALDGEWRRLRASVRLAAGGLGRASLEAEGPRVRVEGLSPEPFAASGDSLSVHARPSAARGEAEGAFDVAVRAAGAVLPGLDELLGGAEPADFGADAAVTRLAGLGPGSLPALAERWRAAGGRVELSPLAVAKGPRRLEARGALGLDDQRRPAGRLDVAAAGIEGTLGALANRTAGAAAVLGMLGARPARPEGERARPGAPKPLAALRLEGGRVLLGPVPIPGVRLLPIY